MPIKFGTDGWRDIIAQDFTYANVQAVARAHAAYLLAQGGSAAVVGHDTRFQGEGFAAVAAQSLAAAGLTVHLNAGYLPTPALSFAVRHLGAAGGVMITASHNPPVYSGYKLKGPYGGSATPAIVAAVEGYLHADPPAPAAAATPAVQTPAVQAPAIQPLGIQQDYFRALDGLLNLDALRAYRGRVFHDAMGGAGAGWLAAYARHAGLALEVEPIRGEPTPLFYGVNPEPIPQNLDLTMQRLAQESGSTFAVVTDGDADRVGAVTAGGHFFNSHQIFAVLLKHLHDKGLRGRVVKTVSGSGIIDRLCAVLGLELLETPVGFKYITDAFLEGEADPVLSVLMGGEESGGLASRGHIPERDGLYNGLLLLEAVAVSGKPLEVLVRRSRGADGISALLWPQRPDAATRPDARRAERAGQRPDRAGRAHGGTGQCPRRGEAAAVGRGLRHVPLLRHRAGGAGVCGSPERRGPAAHPGHRHRPDPAVTLSGAFHEK